MADAYHSIGSDLMLNAGGDLALATGPVLGQQRILRRLLTNPGDYLWNLSYGAGLGQFIGTPATSTHIAAVVRSQVFQEASVAPAPEPVIELDFPRGSGYGDVYVSLRYADSDAGEMQLLNFSVSS